jgi:hypothetical protein
MQINSDCIYNHEKYGNILVVSVAELYDQWPPREEISPENRVVFFYDQYDGYGGLGTLPIMEPVAEFERDAEFVEEHDFN